MNSSRMTPMSAAAWTVSLFSTTPNWAGPSRTPATRNPTIGTTRTRAVRYPITAAATTRAATGPR
ncbi:hypothetical protein E4P40_23085 [Blastococcus sp. CT_GayMR20]|uniref:hypothetical protein n=1 Tax=Blastococcus sp. CT_GayMR20 TaxID=2559609 RepID=UPI0010744958|nr:hypothetical protein [Blastococcus sp. CT_GayMR20]TFV68657.1 hypothetical protein E4P40_23085 [Blastococcus sp. CT_GayMR20]